MQSLRKWQVAAFILMVTFIFAAAYSQSPLYTSNQYQYFLHGLARAGVGYLSADWLANTVDYTPLFSWLVEVTARMHAEGLFYVYYAALMGIYLFSLVGIVDAFFPLWKQGWALGVFLAGMIGLHSAALRFVLMRLPGAEWAYLFDGGFAGQRLLGPVLQPSVSGVLLLPSICLHVKKKTVPAILVAILAATLHPTYLLSCALLTGTYLLEVIFVEKQFRKAVLMGFLALAAVSPILIYTYMHFMTGEPGITSRAREIMVFIRIPHHALVGDWFDASSMVKLLMIGWALFLIRRSRLFLTLMLPSAVSLALTLVQLATGNLSLALIFPWRLSTWLVPVALAVILGRLVTVASDTLTSRGRSVLKWISLSIVLLAMIAGLVRVWLERLEAQQAPEAAIEAYVAAHRQPGETYLIPTKMYTFRLNAGVPVYGDFFSVPLKSDEFIEWYSRFLNAQQFYEKKNCTLLEEMVAAGVTHVILPKEMPPPCRSLMPVVTEGAYSLYRVGP